MEYWKNPGKLVKRMQYHGYKIKFYKNRYGFYYRAGHGTVVDGWDSERYFETLSEAVGFIVDDLDGKF